MARNRNRNNNRGNDPQTNSSSTAGMYIPIKDTVIQEGVASIPYGFRLGAGFDVNGKKMVNKVNYQIPGIQTIDVMYGPGYSDSPNSGVNVAMLNIFQFLRHNNPRITQYDAPDVGVYLMQMTTPFVLYHELRRLYGIINQVSPVNMYFADDIIKAMGYDVVDITKHKNDLGVYIETFRNQFNVFRAPGNLPLYDYISKMFDKIYTDGESQKSQVTILRPAIYYVFDETSPATQKGGRLVAKDYQYRDPNPGVIMSSTQAYYKKQWYKTYDDIVTICKEVINAFQNSTSVNYISSDIETAYGNNLIQIPPMDLNYVTPVERDEQFLLSLHNAKIYPNKPFGFYAENGNWKWSSSELCNVYQDVTTNAFNWKPCTVAPYGEAGTLMSAIVLDTWNDNPSITEKMNMLAFQSNAIMGYLTFWGTATDETDLFNWFNANQLVAVHPEVSTCIVLTNRQIWTMDKKKTSSGATIWEATGIRMTQFPRIMDESDAEGLYSALQNFGASSFFDWNPLIYVTADNNAPAVSVCKFEDVISSGPPDKTVEFIDWAHDPNVDENPSTQWTIWNILGDLQNYSIAEPDEVDNLLFQQVLSLWNVPNQI